MLRVCLRYMNMSLQEENSILADPPSRFPQRPLLVSISIGAATLVMVLLVVVVHLSEVSLPSRDSLAQARLTPSWSPTATAVPTLPPTNLLSWHSIAFAPGFFHLVPESYGLWER